MSDHKRIWLQTGTDATWCEDKINDDDIEYVRSDVLKVARDALNDSFARFIVLNSEGGIRICSEALHKIDEVME